MPLNHRVLRDNNGTLENWTLELNAVSEDTRTADIVAAQDKLYVGSEHPFNHRYFEVSTANDQASTISNIEVWDGGAWVSAAEIQDGTSSSGVTMAQSGVVTWTPDQDESWQRDDTEDMGSPLSGVKIYALYWARFTFSADFNASTALKYIGQKFVTDEELAAFYPELGLSDAKTQWESGKSDWHEQAVLASESVVRDLKFKGVVWQRNQILDIDLFKSAAAHKLAQIIFTAWGNNYERDRDEARRRYEEDLQKITHYKVDKDKDALLDRHEMISRSTVVRR